MNWTVLIWKLIIAVAPIIAVALAQLIVNLINTLGDKSKANLLYWVNILVKCAQQVEPDPQKRKAWVLAQLMAMFPKAPQEQLSALIEAIVAQLKLASGTSWSSLAPNSESTTPPVA